jgi:tetratricopeptide (TPR) repeat protein
MAKSKEAVKLSTLEEYRQALSADPKSAQAHANLGWEFYGESNWAEAVNAFNQALSLDASLVDAQYGLAMTQKAAGAKPEAVAAFEKTIALTAKLEDAACGKVLARLARGHINQLQSGQWGLTNILGGNL